MPTSPDSRGYPRLINSASGEVQRMVSEIESGSSLRTKHSRERTTLGPSRSPASSHCTPGSSAATARQCRCPLPRHLAR
ncbi:hypothetical protein BV20DRAFT_338273 [Pilatotrama ljubarskyi]|nr:hypothetical protein BV20DRAFT_338273 [Pilatotrama ljubarskyi]